ncbi:MAG: rRNA maturation RNase YbeY [Patescibacteria group bacterium]|nr:rRNA maturation RNase YbeY [Patescibacteria group bacterium]
MVTVDISGRLPKGINASAIKRLAETVLRQVGRVGKFQVALAVVGEKEIRRLNRSHRRQDRVTDVLSFGSPYSNLPAGPTVFLGDVVVCSARMASDARRIGRPAADHFALLFCHGLLHLLGYDHATPRQEAVMFRIQQDALMKAGYL